MLCSSPTLSGFEPPAPSQVPSLLAFAARSFPSTSAFIDAMLEFIAAQVGTRSSFLTEVDIEQNHNIIRAAYNAPDGCAIPLGAQLPLDQTF